MTSARVEVQDRIATLTIDNPPVNALSHSVRAELIEAVMRLDEDESVDALVIACAGRTFIAGADIQEFGKPSLKPFLTTVVDAIAASTKPVVAAIHGTALGDGLEVAMACHYRIAASDAKLGLPEVKLGLMPGARGTQHLPRLVGAAKALEMIAFGDPIDAEEGLRIGLVDRIAATELIPDAVAFAGAVAHLPPPRARAHDVPPVEPSLWDGFAEVNARRFRNLDAPPAIIRAVRAAAELPFDEGAALERAIFLELRAGPQNEALRHVFFAEREAAKVPGLDGVKPRAVERIGVVGAGTMGTGIAVAFLLAGLPVTLVETSEKLLSRGSDSIRKTIEANVARGRTPATRGARALASLATSLDYASLGQADLIVEAAFETMTVKREIFAALDRVAKPAAILATNTSYLDVAAIAAATSRPGDVIGLHFFSPANVMKLLEIVRAPATAPDVLATALGLAKRIGKVAVVSGNAYGFIGNRMLAVRRREADAMVLEGASPYEVDRVLERFGFPMGPFRMSDLAGLDLGWSPGTSTGGTIRERLCAAERRGQKTAAGFYDYDESRRPVRSLATEAIIAGLAADLGITRRAFKEQEILARLLWPMIDEGARLLEEGIALRASDIDVVWLNGYPATSPCERSFSPPRMQYCETAPISVSRSVTGDPNDLVTAMPRRCGSTASTALAATPWSSATSRSSTTVIDQPRGEVDRLLHVVLRWRREAGGGRTQQQPGLPGHHLERDVMEGLSRQHRSPRAGAAVYHRENTIGTSSWLLNLPRMMPVAFWQCGGRPAHELWA